MSGISTRSGYWLLLALAAAFFLYLRGGSAGRQAPDFTVQDVYGGSVELSSFRGRPLLVVFWTTYCDICRRELPIVDRVAAELDDRVAVLAVNIGDLQGARAFMREEQLRLANAVDQTGEAARSYGVGSVPWLVLIDASGKIVNESGWLSEPALRRWLRNAAGSG